jgi:hypothetical protein
MSLLTNVPYQSKSLFGVITLSDGNGTIIQNGVITCPQQNVNKLITDTIQPVGSTDSVSLYTDLSGGNLVIGSTSSNITIPGLNIINLSVDNIQPKSSSDDVYLYTNPSHSFNIGNSGVSAILNSPVVANHGITTTSLSSSRAISCGALTTSSVSSSGTISGTTVGCSGVNITNSGCTISGLNGNAILMPAIVSVNQLQTGSVVSSGGVSCAGLTATSITSSGSASCGALTTSSVSSSGAISGTTVSCSGVNITNSGCTISGLNGNAILMPAIVSVNQLQTGSVVSSGNITSSGTISAPNISTTTLTNTNLSVSGILTINNPLILPNSSTPYSSIASTSLGYYHCYSETVNTTSGPAIQPGYYNSWFSQNTINIPYTYGIYTVNINLTIANNSGSNYQFDIFQFGFTNTLGAWAWTSGYIPMFTTSNKADVITTGINSYTFSFTYHPALMGLIYCQMRQNLVLVNQIMIIYYDITRIG